MSRSIFRAGQASSSLTARRAILVMGLLLAALLALPRATVTTKYVNDLFIFLDGAHRIWSGQVPNVDFHSSLGPLAFYVPAVGYGLTGSMGAAMPVGIALVVLFYALLAAEVIASRMAPAVGLPLASFLMLIVAVPANPGEWIGELSFAMFYNRMGWAALGLLFVMYLPRRDLPSTGGVRDACCASLLVLLMLYTKITYGVVQIAFLGFLLTDREQRRWVMISLLLIGVAMFGVEVIWGGSSGYLADLRLAGDVSGEPPTVRMTVETVLRNLADIVVFVLLAVVLLLVRRRFRDLLFVGFCGATGLLIIEQNFQVVGILTFGAGAAVAAELLLRQRASPRSEFALGLPLALTALLLPAAAIHAGSLTMHAYLAASGKGEVVGLPAFSQIRLAQMWSPGQFDFFRRYNETLIDGERALRALDVPLERVAVLDFVNPFAAGMSLRPPEGDSAWYHWGRTLDRLHHPDAQEIFADAIIVMEPKAPIERWTASGMSEIYADYLGANYQLVADTAFWRIHHRRSSE